MAFANKIAFQLFSLRQKTGTMSGNGTEGARPRKIESGKKSGRKYAPSWPPQLNILKNFCKAIALQKITNSKQITLHFTFKSKYITLLLFPQQQQPQP